jgi:hypothetical protein
LTANVTLLDAFFANELRRVVSAFVLSIRRRQFERDVRGVA